MAGLLIVTMLMCPGRSAAAVDCVAKQATVLTTAATKLLQCRVAAITKLHGCQTKVVEKIATATVRLQKKCPHVTAPEPVDFAATVESVVAPLDSDGDTQACRKAKHALLAAAVRRLATVRPNQTDSRDASERAKQRRAQRTKLDKQLARLLGKGCQVSGTEIERKALLLTAQRIAIQDHCELVDAPTFPHVLDPGSRSLIDLAQSLGFVRVISATACWGPYDDRTRDPESAWTLLGSESASASYAFVVSSPRHGIATAWKRGADGTIVSLDSVALPGTNARARDATAAAPESCENWDASCRPLSTQLGECLDDYCDGPGADTANCNAYADCHSLFFDALELVFGAASEGKPGLEVLTGGVSQLHEAQCAHYNSAVAADSGCAGPRGCPCMPPDPCQARTGTCAGPNVCTPAADATTDLVAGDQCRHAACACFDGLARRPCEEGAVQSVLSFRCTDTPQGLRCHAYDRETCNACDEVQTCLDGIGGGGEFTGAICRGQGARTSECDKGRCADGGTCHAGLDGCQCAQRSCCVRITAQPSDVCDEPSSTHGQCFMDLTAEECCAGLELFQATPDTGYCWQGDECLITQDRFWSSDCTNPAVRTACETCRHGGCDQ